MSRGSRTVLAAIVLAGCVAAVAGTPPASAAGVPAPAGLNVFDHPLTPAQPAVVTLHSQPQRAPIRLRDGLSDWPGRDAHIAGQAHYDRGEWIYEDYPWTAYGAANAVTLADIKAMTGLSSLVPLLQRLSQIYFTFVSPSAGAGPYVDAADVSELRLATRGHSLDVLARTTTMHRPVSTALLLLFHTGHADATARTVPFGSGLTTRFADVAVLVTGHGAFVTDLRSGRTIRAPAAADPDGYRNSLQTRLPLSTVADHGRVRFVAAAGVVQPDGHTLVASGDGGPLAKVIPRFGEPVQGIADQRQAVALAMHDIDPFATTVSVPRMRRGRSERLVSGIGYTVRTYWAPKELSHENGIEGRLQQYGLYLPRGYRGGPVPTTVVLHGSDYTANSMAAITSELYRQLGDDNGAVLISPGARSGISLFEGAGYLDVEQAVRNAGRLVRIDPNRLSVAGYSMGGYGAILFAETQPDRFAAAFDIEGPIATRDQLPVALPVPDLTRAVDNLRYVPTEIYQGDADVNVALPNGLDLANRLRDLGYRYQLNVFPAHTHYSAGIHNDYTYGVRLLKSATRTAHPAVVRLTRDMSFERDVDRGAGSDLPDIGHSVGLRFDRAWFVHGLQPTHRRTGRATAVVRTYGRPAPTVHPVQSAGIDPGHHGEVPSAYEAQTWRLTQSGTPLRNALSAHLTGVSRITLVLRQMKLTLDRPLRVTVHSDQRTRLTLAAGSGKRVTVTVRPGRSVRTIRAGAGWPGVEDSAS
ncbi:MAG TPA: alpha/beta hydrolase-fold protein [Mycobacteriales bacterium]|nr:alpha/beta hydrolase-fold protein [Mycobacteriales bacterium]